MPDVDPSSVVRFGDFELPYRRALLMRATGPTVVVADLEDDFHRFRVTLRHSDGTVERVEGEALRYPWTTCVDAIAPLHELDGTELTPRMAACARHANPRANCTHLFDLAGLAIAHAARGGERRRYDIDLSPRVDTRSVARLRRDDAALLEWHLVDGTLVDPSPYTEGPWRGGFLRWADATFEPDEAEAAIVLRRACDIGLGRGMDLESYDTASELLALTEGACYTMRTGIAENARRVRGTIRDFGATPEALLGDVDP